MTRQDMETGQKPNLTSLRCDRDSCLSAKELLDWLGNRKPKNVEKLLCNRLYHQIQKVVTSLKNLHKVNSSKCRGQQPLI